MTFKYNVTGAKRKELVSAISEITETPVKYLGAPSFAYEVDYFTIDKNGGVTFDDRADSEEIEMLAEALLERGFEPEPRFEQPQPTDESGLGGMDALDEAPDIDQHHPGQYADPDIPFTPEMQKQIDDYFLGLPMTEKIKEQILAIRDTGLTN